MALYDTFYDEQQAKEIEYGLFPWYSNRSMLRPHEPFLTGMCLIVKEQLIDFDVRGNSKFFHIVSQHLVDIMRELGEPFEDVQPVDVRDPNGQAISNKKYYVARFKRYDMSDVLDLTQSELFPKRGGLPTERVKRFRVRDGFAQHAFQIKTMAPGHDTVFCSKEFVQLALSRDLKGVDFLPMEGNASGAFTQI
jgi:hypothetical protein